MRRLGTLLMIAVLGVAAGRAAAAPTDAPAERPRCAITMADPDLAIRYCSEAIASGQLTGEPLALAYVVRALAHRVRDRFDDAIADFSTAIGIEPHPSLIAERGKTFAMAHRHQEAIADFETAAQRNKQLARMFEEAAEWFAEGHYFTEAILYFDGGLRALPNDTHLIRRRGDMEDSLGRQDAAIALYEAGLRIEPDNASLHASRAVALMHKRAYDRALGDLDRALELQPKFAQARYTRARALFDLARFGEAAEEFRRTMEDGRRDSYTAVWRYLSLSRDGKYGRAELRESVRTVDIERWPAPVMALLLDAITPEQLLTIALDAEPRTARNQRCEALFFTGQYHLLAGRTDEAVAAFEAAVGTGVIEFVEYWHAKAELQRLRQ
jgi:lipoprotein NlpI